MRHTLVIILSAVLACGGCSTSASMGKSVEIPVFADYSVTDHQFEDSLSNLLKAPMVEGNNITELVNGKEIFPAMLSEIHKATRTITLETFIWSSGQIGTKFVDALAERAKAGVKVKVIVDAIGSNKLRTSDINALKAAGVEVMKYNPPLSLHVLSATHRTHRKLLVVDGRVGFTGGVCINDDWDGDAEPKHWRDTHFRVEGPVVGHLQAAFADNWLQTKSEVLHGEDYFPHLARAGNMKAQGFVSGPSEGAEGARMNYLLSIAAARKSIRIAHAYFVPDDLVQEALCAAARRGVNVEILFPRRIDNVAVRKAGWTRMEKLFDADVHFFEYEPTFYHCKIVIVDDVWSMVGSVNMDDRSLRINDEANLNVMSWPFAATLIKSFEKDKAQSRPLTKEDFKKRTASNSWTDRLAGLFRAQL